MFKGKRVCVVVPAFNEVTQIAKVVNTMPALVDAIVIVDDCSTDGTVAKVNHLKTLDGRIELIEHQENKGVGGAIASGYKFARDHGFDVAVVMAGDAQMDPADMPRLLDPVVDEGVDYAKGNRLFTGEAFNQIPKVRYFGNAILSLLTKIASGYWHVADSQTGYTAINNKALNLIDWDAMYKRYGQPNDLLVRLNVFNLRVRDVPVRPVYNVGEHSGIKIHKVIFTIPWMLLRLFVWRMLNKYVIRDFHPLVFFYFLGFLFSVTTFFLGARMCWFWYATEVIPKVNALAFLFSFMAASQFTLFAMWFDMEANKDLR